MVDLLGQWRHGDAIAPDLGGSAKCCPPVHPSIYFNEIFFVDFFQVILAL
jgi:hypothetical protein